MEIRLKSLYGNSSKVPYDIRGRSYDIGKIVAGVSLTEDGLTITISNRGLGKKLKQLLEEEQSYQ